MGSELPEQGIGNDGHDGDEAEAGEGGAADVRRTVLSPEMADLHGGGGAHAVVRHEKEGADGQHDLMGGQGDGADPADHDGGQRERGGFHTHLQGERPAQGIEPVKVGAVDGCAGEAVSVGAVAGQFEEEDGENEQHDDAREKCGNARAGQAQFGKSAHAVDEQPVAGDIEQVAAEQNPHGCAGIHDAVCELPEGVEQQDEYEGRQYGQIVRLDERHELGGLAEFVEVAVQDGHAEGEKNACGGVDGKRVLEFAADTCTVACSGEFADDGGESVGKARAADDDEAEQVVDEAGGAQRFGVVVPDHHGVGESQDDDADLADDDGSAQYDQSADVVGDGDGLFHVCLDVRRHRPACAGRAIVAGFCVAVKGDGDFPGWRAVR